MKSTRFRKVIHEEIIEVKTSVADTINRLCEQAGKCSAETPDGSPLFFDCSKKGEFFVRNYYNSRYGRNGRFQLYYVYGEVFSENGKTYVRLTSVYNRSDIIWVIVSMAFTVLLASLLLFQLFSGGYKRNVVRAALIAAVFIAETVYLVSKTRGRVKNRTDIVELMENEARKRVQNLERWDD